MSVLVYAEHDNESLKIETNKLVHAALGVSSDIVVLVAGSGCAAIAEAAAKISGVCKVILADNAVYEHQLPENIADLVVEVAADY